MTNDTIAMGDTSIKNNYAIWWFGNIPTSLLLFSISELSANAYIVVFCPAEKCTTHGKMLHPASLGTLWDAPKFPLNLTTIVTPIYDFKFAHNENVFLHYAKLTIPLPLETRFPKIKPTYRSQAVNPQHQTPQGQFVAKPRTHCRIS